MVQQVQPIHQAPPEHDIEVERVFIEAAEHERRLLAMHGATKPVLQSAQRTRDFADVPTKVRTGSRPFSTPIPSTPAFAPLGGISTQHAWGPAWWKKR